MRIKSKGFFVIAFLISIQSGYSQYRTSFQIQDKSIKVILFQAQQVSFINIETKNQSNFKFKSASEGTYKTELYFDFEVKQDSLIIKSIYPKQLEFGDNKMTSMQEFSVSVSFTIPKHQKLIIDSDMASVEGSGVFENIQINTKSGYCKLTDFVGDASINTYSGKIYISTRQAKVKARTQTGNLNIAPALVENYHLNLRTVNGDIEVIQTK